MISIVFEDETVRSVISLRAFSDEFFFKMLFTNTGIFRYDEIFSTHKSDPSLPTVDVTFIVRKGKHCKTFSLNCAGSAPNHTALINHVELIPGNADKWPIDVDVRKFIY